MPLPPLLHFQHHLISESQLRSYPASLDSAPLTPNMGLNVNLESPSADLHVQAQRASVSPLLHFFLFPPSKDEVQPAAAAGPEPETRKTRKTRKTGGATPPTLLRPPSPTQDAALGSSLYFQHLLANHTTHSLSKLLPPPTPPTPARRCCSRPGWWREGGRSQKKINPAIYAYLSLGWHHSSELKQTH